MLTSLKLTERAPCDRLPVTSPEDPRLSKRTTGVVRWFDGSKGYGYIEAADGEHVFVHYSAIVGQEAPLLREGEQVAFFLEQTVRGPQASEVTRLN